MLILRHTRAAIFLHWFNALCWLFLLASGFALLDNPETQPVGAWWPALWSGLPVLFWHEVVGCVWATVCAVVALCSLRSVSVPFLREIFRLSPAEDALWCWRKALNLVFGGEVLRRRGIKADLPPQGFYNAGQKYVAILAVASSVLLVLSGAGLMFAPHIESTGLIQWLIVLHFACAGLMALALPVHIYMAALAPGEKPALLSMFSGRVPASFVEHHNPRWYAELKASGKLSELK